MGRMARALGIDLGAAVQNGHIDRKGIRHLQMRCSMCDRSFACARVLAEGHDIEAAPDYCVNKKKLAELAQRDTSVRLR